MTPLASMGFGSSLMSCPAVLLSSHTTATTAVPYGPKFGELQHCRAAAPHVHCHWIPPHSTLKTNSISNWGLLGSALASWAIWAPVFHHSAAQSKQVFLGLSQTQFNHLQWSADRMRLCSPLMAFFTSIVKFSYKETQVIPDFPLFCFILPILSFFSPPLFACF